MEVSNSRYLIYYLGYLSGHVVIQKSYYTLSFAYQDIHKLLLSRLFYSLPPGEEGMIKQLSG